MERRLVRQTFRGLGGVILEARVTALTLPRGSEKHVKWPKA